MNIRREFENFPVEDIPEMPESFFDWSWHNDVCPSFGSVKLKLVIFIDYADPAMRERPDCARFSVYRLDADDCIRDEPPLLATNDWSDVLHCVFHARVDAEIAAIADEYKAADEQ